MSILTKDDSDFRQGDDRECFVGSPYECGFTLLEVMIALAIVGITFVSLLGLRNRDIVLSNYSREIMEATLLARQKMTEIEMTGFPELGEASGGFDETKFQWREQVIAPELLPALSNMVREVRVTVSWSDEKEKVDLVAYLFKH